MIVSSYAHVCTCIQLSDYDRLAIETFSSFVMLVHILSLVCGRDHANKNNHQE